MTSERIDPASESPATPPTEFDPSPRAEPSSPPSDTAGPQTPPTPSASQPPQPEQQQSESDRVSNLMSLLGRRETEKQAIAEERDAARRERDEARAEAQRIKSEADAQSAAWASEWAKVPQGYTSPMAPTSPIRGPNPITSQGSRTPHDVPVAGDSNEALIANMNRIYERATRTD